MNVRSVFDKLKKAGNVAIDPQDLNRNASENGAVAGKMAFKAGKWLLFIVFGGFLLLLFYAVFFAGGFLKSIFKIKDD